MIPYSDTNSRVAKSVQSLIKFLNVLETTDSHVVPDTFLSEASLLKYCWMRSWLLVQSIMVLRDDAVTLRS